MSARGPAVAAVVALLAAAYCFAGLLMTASFTAAVGSDTAARGTVLWGIAGLALLAAAAWLGWTARQRSRKGGP